MAKLIAGFTGTQKGMTVGQVRKLKELLQQEGVTEFHHGDCIGADARAHTIARELNIDVVIHQPTKADKRAYCEDAIKVHETKEYLVRNKDIVNDSKILFATPGEASQVLRSGTWSTVRFGIKSKRKVFVIKPDGEVDIYND